MKRQQATPLPLDVRLMNVLTVLLLCALALMLLTALGARVLRNERFALAGITVVGDVAHTNAVMLRANVAPRLSGNFFTLDLARARAAFEAVPWVRLAVVRREFPNRLRVVLSEHQPAAYWGAEGESRLVNTFGEVFEANPDDIEADDLPTLKGPDGQSAQVLAMYRALKPELQRLDANIDGLELSGRGGWQVHLDNGAVIEIGRGNAQEAMERLRRFLGTLPQVSSRYGRSGMQSVEYADLRHVDGYALRLRGVTTFASAAKK